MRNKILKKTMNVKSIIFLSVSTICILVATTFSATASFLWFYQPKLPKNLR